VNELHNVTTNDCCDFNQRSADGALQQYICMCCRCVKYLNLSNLLMVSGVTPHSLLDQEISQLGEYHKEAHRYPNVAGKRLFLFLSVDYAINVQFGVGEIRPILQILS
jgi:hypothetical protein